MTLGNVYRKKMYGSSKTRTLKTKRYNLYVKTDMDGKAESWKLFSYTSNVALSSVLERSGDGEPPEDVLKLAFCRIYNL